MIKDPKRPSPHFDGTNQGGWNLVLIGGSRKGAWLSVCASRCAISLEQGEL